MELTYTLLSVLKYSNTEFLAFIVRKGDAKHGMLVKNYLLKFFVVLEIHECVYESFSMDFRYLQMINGILKASAWTYKKS